MPSCPKCNEANAATATRCQRCGASLIGGGTSRITSPTARPVTTAAAQVSSSGLPKFLLPVIALLVAACVVYWYVTSPKSIEVENGVRISIPAHWKELEVKRINTLAEHTYRGEEAEKVALHVAVQSPVPPGLRDKEARKELLRQLVAEGTGTDEALIQVVDLSHDSITHLRCVLHDAKIASRASSQLALNDYKHSTVGIITVDGNFILYALVFDEPKESYAIALRSIDELAAGR